MQQAKDLLHGTAQFGFKFQVSQHEVGTEGDPYLGQYRVACGAEECLDLQVLLDPLEEQLDLPSFLVDFGNLLSLDVVGVGDEPILDAGFRVGVSDQAQRLLDAFESDVLIVGNAKALSPGPFEQVLDIGIAFQPRNKENGVSGQIAVPAVIGEAAIDTNKGPFGEFQRPGPADLVFLAPSHVHEDRQVTVGVQADMQFDGPLFLPEFGPGKGGEAKIDHRGIKQVELAFERETVFRRYQLAPVQQPSKQDLIEGSRLFGVDPSQGCFGGALHAEVIEPIALGLQIVGDIPETFSAGKLADQHGDELAPAVEGTEFLPRMMRLGKRIEFISREKCNQLLENSVAICHGSDLLGLYDLFAKSLYLQRALRASFSSIFMRQQ